MKLNPTNDLQDKIDRFLNDLHFRIEEYREESAKLNSKADTLEDWAKKLESELADRK